MDVLVFAGETLTLEAYAEEEDLYGDNEGYRRNVKMQMVLAEAPLPGDLNGDGVVG